MVSKTYVILGGGISGLATAFRLAQKLKQIQQHTARILLIEKTNYLGGWIKTIKNNNGSIYELGPRTLRCSTESSKALVSMIEQLGLQNDLLLKYSFEPAFKRRFINLKEHNVQLPTSLWSMFKTYPPFSSSVAKFMLKEVLTPRLDLTLTHKYLALDPLIRTYLQKHPDYVLEDTSVNAFAALRLDSTVASYLADPICRGISSGDSQKLSIRSMFPDVFQAERETGCAINAMFSNKTKPSLVEEGQLWNDFQNNKVKMLSFNQGLAQLPNAIGEYLKNEPTVEIQLNSTVESVEMYGKDNGALVRFKDSNRKTHIIWTDHIFSAIPSFALSKVLTQSENSNYVNEMKSVLNSIHFASVALVNLEYNCNILNHDQAFGFLVPSSISKMFLGATFDSCIFPEHDGLNSGTRLTWMLGGDWYDEVEPYERKPHDLYLLCVRSANFSSIKKDPSYYKVTFNKNAIPQYRVGHYVKLELLDKLISGNKLQLSLVGNSYRGIGVPDCISNAFESVDKVVAQFATDDF